MKVDKKKSEPEIPTASMADIAFLLIVFFMITSVFSVTRGIEFQLPKNDTNAVRPMMPYTIDGTPARFAMFNWMNA